MKRPVAALPCWLLVSEDAYEDITLVGPIRQAMPRVHLPIPFDPRQPPINAFQ